MLQIDSISSQLGFVSGLVKINTEPLTKKVAQALALDFMTTLSEVLLRKRLKITAGKDRQLSVLCYFQYVH